MKKLLLVLTLFLSGCEKNEPKKGTTILTPAPRTIVVNSRGYEMFDILMPDGEKALTLNKGDWFDVRVEDHLPDPTCIHWHGLIVPNNQDGVPFVTQLPIASGKSYPYHFRLVQSGTFWMHSHYGLQEQRLMSAPLILLDPENPVQEDQDVIVMFEDFSFTSPRAILDGLRNRFKDHPMNAAGMKEMQGQPDLVEVKYDAFLANRKTLSDPEIIRVSPGSTIRLRLIDASCATNFFVDLGELEGEAVAVDGNEITPLKGQLFELADAQRIDIRLTIPLQEGAYPILAIGEGTNMQAGIILATPDAGIPKIPEKRDLVAGALSYSQEKEFRPIHPLLPKPIDRSLDVVLGGNMISYVWTINGKAWPKHTPLMVKEGERVEVVFSNQTGMSHPMHLHGHVFQVTEIDGLSFNGAMRDTVLVKPGSVIKIQFDAVNPGIWPLHCHLLYHRVSGMFTTLNYEGYPVPSFVSN